MRRADWDKPHRCPICWRCPWDERVVRLPMIRVKSYHVPFWVLDHWPRVRWWMRPRIGSLMVYTSCPAHGGYSRLWPSWGDAREAGHRARAKMSESERRSPDAGRWAE